MKKSVKRSDLIYPELSYSVIGSAMDAHNGLGPGWDEWDFHRAMIHALTAKGHDVASHDRKDLIHRYTVVDNFERDLLVGGAEVHQLYGCGYGVHVYKKFLTANSFILVPLPNPRYGLRCTNH